jgi:hypothetical protein
MKKLYYCIGFLWLEIDNEVISIVISILTLNGFKDSRISEKTSLTKHLQQPCYETAIFSVEIESQ